MIFIIVSMLGSAYRSRNYYRARDKNETYDTRNGLFKQWLNLSHLIAKEAQSEPPYN